MLVLGGTGSIGGEIARQALAAGWRVVVQGRSAEKLAALETQHGGRLVGIAGDIGRPGEVERVVAEAAQAFGRIDAAVDCVSTGAPGILGRFTETDPAAYARHAELSIVHFQRFARAVLPWLARNGGTLIAFISDAGIFAAPNQTMIGAMRAATIGFVRNLALEVSREAVRVHAVSPSYVAESASAQRMGSSRMEKAAHRAGLGLPTAADIAPLVLFLCGDGARKITGQVISVNGGLNA
ncbi:MAG: SDR family oxidoreductase [Novosphingobium sp.]|nr:SDR family oxidoreductase [Novosphingobium sp.]